ncbi:MAG: Crp/Fnr family transcriptional regulator [Alphaproteobacteria bacterium]
MTRQQAEAPAVDLSCLAENHLLSQLQPEELEEVRQFSRVVAFDRDEVIFSKGDDGDSLFVILDGRIGIRTVSESGKQLFLNILEQGEVLGEIGLLDGRERTAGAMAMEPSRLLKIDRTDFIPFLERHPKLGLRLMSVLCERLRWTSEIIESTIFLDIPRRLAKRLLALAEDHGGPEDKGTKVSIGLSQEDLANMLGATRESVNKVLRSLQRQGVIRYDRDNIVILDPRYLKALVSGD